MQGLHQDLEKPAEVGKKKIKDSEKIEDQENMDQ